MRISDWSSDVCSSDLVERVAEGRRVLHYRAQRTVYIVALARRQTHAEIGAVQRCGSVFDERDGLSVRRARKAVRCVGGIESGFAHQRLWIAAQCRDQFREEAQQLGMHEVEDRKSTRLNYSH